MHARDYSRRNGAWFPAFVGVVAKISRALARAFFFGSLLFQILNPPLAVTISVQVSQIFSEIWYLTWYPIRNMVF